MSRGRGQIPPYGEHFRLESLPYHPELANRAYALKQDDRWFVRSDKTSKAWVIYHGADRDLATAMCRPLPSLTAAMAKLLDGIARDFYQITRPLAS